MSKQTTFASASFDVKKRKTRREIFLAQMDRVVPWKALEALVEPHYPREGRRGRPPMPLETMLRIHFLQQWYALSDPGMEDALYEIESMRRFAGIELNEEAIPDETTILKFRRLLENHDLAAAMLAEVNAQLEGLGMLMRHGTIVDATIIAAPSSTKNKDQSRDPEMHQTKKGNQYYFGMKAHIGVDAETGLVHTVVGTAANVADVTMAAHLLHGKEELAYADAGYAGVEKRAEVQDKVVDWKVAVKRGTIRAMTESELKQWVIWMEYLKSVIRSKVEHPFRVIKRQFGYVKVRYKGLAKNTAQVVTLFALSNLWMVRRSILRMMGYVCLAEM
ncbi:IS5 family transposase [Dyella flagellata]|uniref:IS5 family transposase n=1 Tax=Dyella flagellata TaxID=1867833 RepID=UPI0024E0A310|nr:IS5 family transposase [Dyella flagellata]